jgi:predicted flap endonuclease-1-like 5' DNA nuclease
MVASIDEIEGVGAAFAAKLREAGVATTEALLERGGTPQGRASLAQATGIGAQSLLRWVNHADLYRIKGVAAEMSELLEAAGVDSVPELAQRVAANLYQRMSELNQQKQLVRRPPTEAQVAAWIDEARVLPRLVSY